MNGHSTGRKWGVGFPRQRQQQIQRDVETRQTIKKRNELISKKLPSEEDLPLLHGTATAENRLDGIIWKADHSQLLESRESVILDRGGCWCWSKGGNPWGYGWQKVLQSIFKVLPVPFFTSRRWKTVTNTKRSYWHPGHCGFPSQALVPGSGFMHFLSLWMINDHCIPLYLDQG